MHKVHIWSYHITVRTVVYIGQALLQHTMCAKATGEFPELCSPRIPSTP